MLRFYAFISCLSLLCCKPKELSVQQLQAFVHDKQNGLQQSTEVSGTSICVTYRPSDVWVHQEIDHTTIDQVTLDSLRKKYSDYYYFVLSISRNDEEALHMVSDLPSYSQLVETMSFRMPQYVTLTTTRQDTIPVGDFMMNRTYGLGSSTELLFAFSKEKIINNDWIQFNLNEFGLSLGNHRFKFTVDDLESAPNVKFSVIN